MEHKINAGRAYFNGYGDIVHLTNHGNPRWPFTDGTHYFDESGTFSGRDRKLDLLPFSQSTGPVVTETVTKTRIVPGVYGRVQVVTYANSDRMDLALLPGRTFTPDELDAAAAVLSALAKGLRDA